MKKVLKPCSCDPGRYHYPQLTFYRKKFVTATRNKVIILHGDKVCPLKHFLLRGWFRALIWAMVELCQVEGQPEAPLWLMLRSKIFKLWTSRCSNNAFAESLVLLTVLNQLGNVLFRYTLLVRSQYRFSWSSCFVDNSG